jgi:NTP pyrophosphatase (non-canonical NTP hydrolase)
MNIKQILELQVAQDEANGFPVKFTNSTAQYDQLTKDLVGLFGEIGEFANIIKKINIKLANPDKYELEMDIAEMSLREELIDSFIYIIRIAAILNVDIEEEVIKKMQLNANRYAPLCDR